MSHRLGSVTAIVSIVLVVVGCGSAATTQPSTGPSIAPAAPVSSASAAPPSADPSPSPKPTAAVALEPPATPDLQAGTAVQALLEKHDAAWDAYDAEAILALFSADATTTELGASIRDAPRAAIEKIVHDTLSTYPEVANGPSRFFVNQTDGIESFDGWNFLGTTKADPMHEVQLFETGGGLLTSQRYMYELDTLRRLLRGNDTIYGSMQGLMDGYAKRWSSGDAANVATLYAPTASRTDRLWGQQSDGKQEVQDAAARFAKTFPGATWRTDLVFGDGVAPGDVPVTGGLFTITLAEPAGCELGLAVLLELDKAGYIATDRWLWDVESLRRCGLG